MYYVVEDTQGIPMCGCAAHVFDSWGEAYDFIQNRAIDTCYEMGEDPYNESAFELACSYMFVLPVKRLERNLLDQYTTIEYHF